MVTFKEAFIFRPAGMEDLQAVVDLMNACSIKAIGQADDTVEGIGADWQAPGFDQRQSQRVIVSPQGQIVGFAEVRNLSRPSYPFLDVYVHPEYEAAGITETLVEWGENRARDAMAHVPADARVAMQAATYAQDDWYTGVLEKAGMQPIRGHWRMEIVFDAPPLPPVWPDPITVRTMIPGQDERRVLEVNRASFRDHWGYVERPFEDEFKQFQYHWQHEVEFDPALWFLAIEGERIVGIALCQPSHNGETDVGWVSILGVLREYRRHGIGEALLRHSFQGLYRYGKKRVGLGVDASSLTGATRLYQKVGMSVVTQITIYEKELRAGRDLARRE